jgi:putative nucleotidyltransferase with HDIG domain
LIKIRTRVPQSTYAITVFLVGAAVAIDSLWRLRSNPPEIEWFLLAALTLLTGSFTVPIPSLAARISVSETFVFTSTLLFGPPAGTITAVLDALIISFWMKRSKSSLVRVLFTATAPAIAVRISSEAFFFVSGATPGSIVRTDVSSVIAPLFLFASLYFLINTGLFAGALATERQESPLKIWIEHFPPLGLAHFVGGSVALLIVAYADRIDLALLSIIIPILLISYLTFRTSLGRVEDANRHVAQVNDLYLSTIEALALAVDAKDQITHGHIRRVQVYAVELAKRLGVKDDQDLKAIEVAALLHDMGKLAIPEHILNKPGKLTQAEFHKMKRHAAIGADLLSSVKFPYPVVPIVRHHHENFGGGGYPSGIAGTDIPLGARILSVVDCFDALTSDRPYRPRMTNEEAFAILSEMRGSMYDPLVVDAFVMWYDEIAPDAIKAGHEARSLITVDTLNQGHMEAVAPLNQISASASEATLLNACDQSLAAAHSIHELVSAAAHTLRQLTPATTFALYLYSPESDELICQSTFGDPLRLLKNLRIAIGERVTGWSAANLSTAVNSEASLDLAQIVSSFDPPLRCALSTPLVKTERLIGVLTAYSPRPEAFQEQHVYVIEHVAATLAAILERRESQVSTVTPFRRVRK